MILAKIKDVIRIVNSEFFLSNWLEEKFNIPPGASMLFAIAIIATAIGIIGIIINYIKSK